MTLETNIDFYNSFLKTQCPHDLTCMSLRVCACVHVYSGIVCAACL